MKRFMFTVGTLVLLCAAAVYLMRDVNSASDENKPEDSVQQSGELQTSKPPMSAPPVSKPEPATDVPPASKSEPATDAPPASKPEPATDVPPASKPPTETLPSRDILLVNAEHPLPKDFRLEHLVKLYDQKNRHFQLAKADIKISQTVFEAMDKMFAAARKDGVKGFIITSGYRSDKEQKEIFSTTTDGTAAKPGESEHEAGIAFDVAAMGNESFELTPQFKWLSKHCAEYGFIIRYPKGMEKVTGYPFEPWHYRYVGKADAVIIMSKGITLEQYLEEQ
ncbi:D-alanyl-D-alanine carboxypeptidase [Paenibacillus taihuensis]|uniref:D-alanyl-D-alanine carboxypeptidase n=1 Tax=Paenibacillus taihuensis TaxID=1156355 RepID=A0A3D9S3T8_9BACL|nr:M15 family metallopeptidase [Paenibacillus taihuensis]REE87448.1 D-alanyl-D-alanine carboxypeptidase [Paenibacillus taihuensis]